MGGFGTQPATPICARRAQGHTQHPHFSVASLWEIVIKGALDRPDFSVDAGLLRRGLLHNDYYELAIEGRHVHAVSTLPLLHRDPFDRILIAQAIAEGFALLTADRSLSAYGPAVRVV